MASQFAAQVIADAPPGEVSQCFNNKCRSYILFQSSIASPLGAVIDLRCDIFGVSANATRDIQDKCFFQLNLVF